MAWKLTPPSEQGRLGIRLREPPASWAPPLPTSEKGEAASGPLEVRLLRGFLQSRLMSVTKAVSVPRQLGEFPALVEIAENLFRFVE